MGYILKLDFPCKLPKHSIKFNNKIEWNSLSEENNEIYKELIECKILHESPDLAYQHINHINSNVEKWWGTATVQNARMNFVSKYARNIKEWEKELALIMKHALNDNELHDLVSGKV